MIWHYTTKSHLTEIVATGEIRPATILIAPGEKPCVWFSSNQIWETTANKRIKWRDGSIREGTKEMLEQIGEGPVRIGVAPETAPHDWHAFKQLSNISAKFARGLYKAGIQCGAKSSEWFVSFAHVPKSKWLAVEIWNGSTWVAFDHS